MGTTRVGTTTTTASRRDRAENRRGGLGDDASKRTRVRREEAGRARRTSGACANARRCGSSGGSADRARCQIPTRTGRKLRTTPSSVKTVTRHTPVGERLSVEGGAPRPNPTPRSRGRDERWRFRSHARWERFVSALRRRFVTTSRATDEGRARSPRLSADTLKQRPNLAKRVSHRAKRAEAQISDESADVSRRIGARRLARVARCETQRVCAACERRNPFFVFRALRLIRCPRPLRRQRWSPQPRHPARWRWT